MGFTHKPTHHGYAVDKALTGNYDVVNDVTAFTF